MYYACVAMFWNVLTVGWCIAVASIGMGIRTLNTRLSEQRINISGQRYSVYACTCTCATTIIVIVCVWYTLYMYNSCSAAWALKLFCWKYMYTDLTQTTLTDLCLASPSKCIVLASIIISKILFWIKTQIFNYICNVLILMYWRSFCPVWFVQELQSDQSSESSFHVSYHGNAIM